ncbi:MAG: hypothetical protein A2W85_10740 [Bacteroidetes bacterium GWF2_41_31]|nr:MAG: hypothetical protein A2W85_10740 [Bacteroidetes bacterium GWF2_41_31]
MDGVWAESTGLKPQCNGWDWALFHRAKAAVQSRLMHRGKAAVQSRLIHRAKAAVQCNGWGLGCTGLKPRCNGWDC